MSFGFGFGLPSWQTLSGGFSPASLFSAGENGAWYDPSDLTTLFTDAAGTTPVTGVEQAVGLMLDKSKGLVPFWSNYFSGSGQYVSTPSNSGFAFGTGDFTVEAWVWSNDVGSSERGFFQTSDAVGGLKSSYTSGLAIGFASAGVLRVYAGASVVSATSGFMPQFAWTHVAVTRASGALTIWINGVSRGTGAVADNLTGTYCAFGGYYSSGFLLNGYLSNLRVVKGTALYTGTFTPPQPNLPVVSGTTLLTCQSSTFVDNSTNALALTLTGSPITTQRISFGNHATSTGTKRPKLAARYNLLTYTEQFNNGAQWATFNASVSSIQETAPNGTLTADKFIPNNATSPLNSAVYSDPQPLAVVGTSYTASIYFKAAGMASVAFQLVGRVTNNGLSAGTIRIEINLSTGTITNPTITNWTNVSYYPVDAENGWWRIFVTGTLPATATRISLDAVNTITGNGTDGVLIWGADLRPASQATGLIGPTYQRVVDAATYDTAGFLPYLVADGVDDAMATNSINPGAVDKAQVFAGVRKLSDAALGMLAELSDNAGGNNGAFWMLAPSSGGLGDYEFRSRGTTNGTATTPTNYAAPRTNVLASIGDISGDVATLRVNGVQAATSAADQGTGNYGDYPLFIAARNQTSLYFNGWIYSLIVRFGSNLSSGQISATEQWVGGKSGVQL